MAEALMHFGEQRHQAATESNREYLERMALIEMLQADNPTVEAAENLGIEPEHERAFRLATASRLAGDAGNESMQGLVNALLQDEMTPREDKFFNVAGQGLVRVPGGGGAPEVALAAKRGPQSPVGKLAADRKAGLITEVEYQERLLALNRGTRGGPTPPQFANNQEILAARQRIREWAAGLPPGANIGDALVKASQKATNTGRDNPDYDPRIERDWRIGTQHLTGRQDSEFQQFQALSRFSVPEAVGKEGGVFDGGPSTGAVPASAPDDVLEFVRTGFGNAGNAPPRSGRDVAGATGASLPLTPGGDIDAGNLRQGTVYEIPNRPGRWRWNGREFHRVR